VRINDDIYFISKRAIQVATTEQVTKVFAFLAKTKLPFTISVKRDKTLSGYQRVELHDVNESTFYTIKEYNVFESLWRTIEYELFENVYTPLMVRFSGNNLDWYVKLTRLYPLQFTQVTTISLSQIAIQGHLQVFKLPQLYTLPSYLYLPRKRLTFFNHIIEGDMYVVPISQEMRIIHLREKAQISSPDHQTIDVDVGEYLLIHPRPRDRVD